MLPPRSSADDAANSLTDNGGVFLLEEPQTGSTTALEDADIAIYGAEEAEFLGGSLSNMGDLDAGGYPELAVSAISQNNRSALVVFSGDALSDCLLSGCPQLSSTDAAWRVVTNEGLTSGDELPDEIDLNGDGLADLIINTGSTDGGAQSGQIFVSYGPLPAGTSSLFELSATLALVDAVFTESSTEAYFGSAVASGDTNGDGKGDLLIGAYQTGGGAAYLIRGQDQ